MLKALIFDCDGVLVDTERDAHRVGFNRAFAEFGIDAEWSVERYAKLLLVAGGKERMRAYFDEFGWPEDDVDEAWRRRRRQGCADQGAAQVQDRRSAEIVTDLPLRPGMLRIIDEAIADDVRLGVCTTSNPKFIDAVLDLFGAGPQGEVRVRPCRRRGQPRRSPIRRSTSWRSNRWACRSRNAW